MNTTKPFFFQKCVQQNGFVPNDDGDGSGEGSGEGSGDGSGDEADDEHEDDGLSVGAIVGIAIGALIGVGIFFFILRKFCCQSSKKTENESANVYMTTNEAFDDPRDDLDGNDLTRDENGASSAGADEGGGNGSN